MGYMGMLKSFWPILVLTAGLLWRIRHSSFDVSIIQGLLVKDWFIGPYFAGNVLRLLAEGILAFLSIILLDSIGVRIIRWVIGRRPVGATRLIAPLLAYGVISLALLGGASAGLWFKVLLGCSVVGVVIFSLHDLSACFADWKKGYISISRDSSGLLKAILAVVVLLAVAIVSLPEVNMDCMQYHMSFPQQVLMAHKLIGNQVFMYWHLPMPIELPYIYFLSVGAETTIRLILMVMMILGGVSFLRAVGFKNGLAMELLIVSTAVLFPEAGWVSMTAKNDIGAVAFGVGGVAVLFQYLKCGGKGYCNTGLLLLSGFLLGCFITAKYVLLPYVVVIPLILFIFNSRRIFELLPLFVCAIIPLGFWGIKTFLFTGDPLYPAGLLAFPGIFGTNSPNILAYQELSVSFSRAMSYEFLNESLLVILPMAILIYPSLFKLGDQRVRGLLIILSAVMLGLIFQLIVMHIRVWELSRFGYFASVVWGLIGMGLYFDGSNINRDYGQPPGFKQVYGHIFMFLAIVIGLSSSISLYVQTNRAINRPGDYLLGKLNKSEYHLIGMSSFGKIYPLICKSLSKEPGASIIEYGYSYPFNSPGRVKNDIIGPHPIWKAVNESDNIERLQKRFKQMNARLLVYNSEQALYLSLRSEPYGWTSRMLRLYGDYFKRYMVLRASSEEHHPYFGAYWLYEIADRPQMINRSGGFLPGIDRAMAPVMSAITKKDFGEAYRLLTIFKSLLPEYEIFDSMTWGPLYGMARHDEAYKALMRAISAGVIHDENLLAAYLMAVRYGHKRDAEILYPKVLSWYPKYRSMLQGKTVNAD